MCGAMNATSSGACWIQGLDCQQSLCAWSLIPIGCKLFAFPSCRMLFIDIVFTTMEVCKLRILCCHSIFALVYGGRLPKMNNLKTSVVSSLEQKILTQKFFLPKVFEGAKHSDLQHDFLKQCPTQKVINC